MIDDTGKDPWPELVVQGEGYWRDVIARRHHHRRRMAVCEALAELVGVRAAALQRYLPYWAEVYGPTLKRFDGGQADFPRAAGFFSSIKKLGPERWARKPGNPR
jgi:hypothetical protein